MMIPNNPISRARSGFTLVEVMIAGTIASVTSIGIFSVFLLSSRFVNQGFTETRVLANTAIAMEHMSRQLNLAFRNNARLAANRPQVSNAGRTITYSIPLGAGTSQRRFRYDAAERILHFEVNNGGWNDIANKVFLRNVDDFRVDPESANQAGAAGGVGSEGFISFVLSVEVDMGQLGIKRQTMVGRALPRNI